jgi:hypothetical protein
VAELIFEYVGVVTRRSDGARFRARAYGARRDDGTWEGWLEFTPAGGAEGARTLRTGQETSQPDRQALAYWASGLEEIYLEGALGRAR